MKSNKHSNKNLKHSAIEKNDSGSQHAKGAKKDRSAKKRLSIYDEFDEEEFDVTTFRGKTYDKNDEEDD